MDRGGFHCSIILERHFAHIHRMQPPSYQGKSQQRTDTWTLNMKQGPGDHPHTHTSWHRLNRWEIWVSGKTWPLWPLRYEISPVKAFCLLPRDDQSFIYIHWKGETGWEYIRSRSDEIAQRLDDRMIEAEYDEAEEDWFSYCGKIVARAAQVWLRMNDDKIYATLWILWTMAIIVVTFWKILGGVSYCHRASVFDISKEYLSRNLSTSARYRGSISAANSPLLLRFEQEVGRMVAWTSRSHVSSISHCEAWQNLWTGHLHLWRLESLVFERAESMTTGLNYLWLLRSRGERSLPNSMMMG